MANIDKNIIITPNIGSSTDDPKIVFSGADATTAAQNITLKAYANNNGTLSFEGSAGQLFSITNSLTGTIFSVNDISGIPSIEVLDDGTVKLAQYNGVVKVGGTTALKIPVGTDAQRPTGEQGMFRYSTTSYKLEGYNGSAWYTIGFGYTGSVGNTGFTGSVGTTGFTGSASTVIGYSGSQGIQGVPGFVGSQGITGFTGSQGIQGVTGFVGSQGIQGITGFAGSQGIQGVTGFTGSQGIQGVVGFTGSQGIQGVTGFTGSQGIQGVTGFVGSRGTTGFTGSQGIQGVTGFTGSQGIQGVVGFTGSASTVIGYSGSVGFVGSVGFAGSRGFSGSVGFTGSQGIQGITGFVGSASTVIGYSGSIGFTGSQGTQGVTGFVGSRGALSQWTVKTSNYTAVDGDRFIAKTTAGTFTVTLPATPATGAYVQITDGDNWFTNNLLINRNGSTIEGYADDVLINIANVSVEFIYDGTTWQFVCSAGPEGPVNDSAAIIYSIALG